jgi:hypothetical protein
MWLIRLVFVIFWFLVLFKLMADLEILLFQNGLIKKGNLEIIFLFLSDNL